MAIAFRNKTQGGGSAATSTVASAPAGLADDDILLYWVYKENTAAVTWPSGFTEVGTITASDSSFQLKVAWKRAASESGTYTASWTGSVWRNYGLSAYSGCITSGSPMDATPTVQANGSSSSMTCPSITTVTANTMLVCSGANVVGSFSTGYPSGMSGRITQDGDLGVADLAVAATGATGTKTFSLSISSQNVGISLALKPAGGSTYNLTASAASSSSTPDTAALPIARGVAAAQTSSSTTPDATALPIARALTRATASTSSTPDTVNLLVSGQISFALAASSTSSTPDTSALPVARSLTRATASTSSTPDTVALPIARRLTLTDASTSTTPDTATLLTGGTTYAPWERATFAPAAESLTSQVRRTYPFTPAAESLTSQAKRTMTFTPAADVRTSEA